MRERCAYFVWTPEPWASTTSFPQPLPLGPAKTTRPPRAAPTGVPASAGKSTPAWNRLPRGPKTSPTGATSGRARLSGQRATGRAQSSDRCRPGGPVGHDPGPALEATKRSVGVRPESAVEVPGGKAMPGERELERGDVPPVRAESSAAAGRAGSASRNDRAPCACAGRARRRPRGPGASGSGARRPRCRGRGRRPRFRRRGLASATRPEALRSRDFRLANAPPASASAERTSRNSVMAKALDMAAVAASNMNRPI